MKRGIKQIPFWTCLLAALIMFGCAGGGSTKVAIKQDSYTPGLRLADSGRLRGKTVILDNFINNASNTKSSGYYSADKKHYYEASAQLESYLWYCFQKAFQHAGIKVLDQSHGAYRHHYHHGYWGPHPDRVRVAAKHGTPEFQLVLTSLTDQESKFQILYFKNGKTKFQKDYTVTMRPATSEDTQELERRSYRMIDKMVSTVFRDRDFQRSL